MKGCCAHVGGAPPVPLLLDDALLPLLLEETSDVPLDEALDETAPPEPEELPLGVPEVLETPDALEALVATVLAPPLPPPEDELAPVEAELEAPPGPPGPKENDG